MSLLSPLILPSPSVIGLSCAYYILVIETSSQIGEDDFLNSQDDQLASR